MTPTAAHHLNHGAKKPSLVSPLMSAAQLVPIQDKLAMVNALI
jgi:hypothetical protein